MKQICLRNQTQVATGLQLRIKINLLEAENLIRDKVNFMNKGGRPKITIDFEMVEKLCAMQCTGEEIAGVLKVNYDTLNARINEEYGIGFSDYYKKHSQSGRASLRRLQWKSAQGGNTPMLIWLGKQYLGQRDKHEHEFDDDSFTPVKITFEQKDCRVEHN